MGKNSISRTTPNVLAMAAAIVVALGITDGAFGQDKNTQPTPTPSPAPQSQPQSAPQSGEKQPATKPKAGSDFHVDIPPEAMRPPPLPKEYWKKGVYLNGTIRDVEAAAKDAQDAYDAYQKTCTSGTDKEKADAKEEWQKWKNLLDEAIRLRVNNIKYVKAARENYAKYDTANESLEKNPNTPKDDLEKSRRERDKAEAEFRHAWDNAKENIVKKMKAKFTYDAPAACPPPGQAVPPEEKKKEKKDKGDTSGPTGLFDNVTIGVGVGGGVHHDDHHDGDRYTDKQSQPGAQNCCTHQGQSVQCPSGLPAGSSSVRFENGGTTWSTPTGAQKFVPQTSFPACR